ncbi:MAG: chaperonin GroEL, partial [Nitrospirota bacterium]|nr:chaperonin GroEL [Nitrospirota bacterium]
MATGGDTEMGAMLGDAVARVGVDGFVLVEDGHGRASQLDIREGMHLDQGYVSAHFVTDEEQMLVELEDPYILLHLGKITELGAVVPALNAFAKADKPLLFIAEDVTGEALSALVVNKLKAGFKVAAAKAPGFGTWRQPMLEDIAIATGGQVVADDLGTTLENLRPEMLGRAQRVRIGKDSTTIINGAGKPEDIEFRVRQLRAAIEREKHLSYDREQLQQRLARLVSGIAVVRVGGATDTEIDERKERVTAAVHTARAAVAEGLVVGGGAALVHASKALDRLRPENDDQYAAIRIVRAALAAPACCIADNLGVDGRWAVAQLLETDDPCQGFDANTGRLGDLFEAGIIDATKVVATACRNAASTAARIVTSEAAIAPLEELK